MSKKKGAVKMSLNDFLADQETGSWADETIDLPTLPVSATEPQDSRSYSSSARPPRHSRGDTNRSNYSEYKRRSPSRTPNPLPDAPPYSAFVGNLDHGIVDDDLKNFFGSFKIVSIRLVKDYEQKPKGFGYVEFATRDDLEKALELNGQQLLNRQVRIDVADAPKPREDFRSRDREQRPPRERREEPIMPSGPWRRETPLAPQNVRPPPSQSGFKKPFEPRSFQPRSFDRSSTEQQKPAAPVPSKPRASPFGAAKPVDQQEKLKKIEEKIKKEKEELEQKLKSQEPTNPEPVAVFKKDKPNPFGKAKPIDQSSIVKKVEEKLKITDNK